MSTSAATPGPPGPCALEVGLLLFPGLTHLDMTGPHEVLARLPGARVRLVWKTREPVRSDSGLTMLPDTGFEDCPQLDLLCVPGGPGVAALMEDDVVHWASHDFLAALGAVPVNARVVRDGNLFTGGGVTAGIDFALTIAAEIAGPEVAQAIQLQIEYAPEPPFAAGHPDVAPAAVLARAKERGAAMRTAREALVARVAARLG